MEKFDEAEAKEHLSQLEKERQRQLEKERLEILSKVLEVLKEKINLQEIQVYLVGSVIQSGKFSKQSDIDIVLRNFKGDRFELWSEIEREIGWKIEIILYEKCNFQDYIDQYGLRII